MKHNNVKLSSIICGLMFLTAGVLLFAFATDPPLLNEKYRDVLFSWQMLPVAIGFVFLFSRHKWIAGVILMLIGGFLMLPKLEDVGLVVNTNIFWAIGLIVVGILVICRALSKKRIFCWHAEMYNAEKKNYSDSCKNKAEYIDRDCVFGGGKEKWDTNIFKGGEINCVFGGFDLDLSDAKLAEGVTRLELNSVFGGVVLYVPIDWNVEIRRTQVFGAFVDNRPKPSIDVDNSKTLVIEANVVFGGGEIKCKNP